MFAEGTRILGDTPFFPPIERRGAHYEVLVFRDGGPCEGLHAARTDIPVLPEPREDAIGLLADTVLPALAARPGFAGALVLGALGLKRGFVNVSKGRSEEYTVRPYECLTLWRTREDMEVSGADLRSLLLRATPPVVPTGRPGTISTTKYDEVTLLTSLRGSP